MSDINKYIELGRVLRDQLHYPENRVVELLVEEYRLTTKELAGVYKDLFGYSAEATGQQMLDTYFEEEVSEALQAAYDLNADAANKLMLRIQGIFTDPLHVFTSIQAIRANEFGYAYRVYIGLDDIGNGKSGWGYFTPNTHGASVMMKLAIQAKINKKEVYVYGRIDDDGKKIKILELGLKQ